MLDSAVLRKRSFETFDELAVRRDPRRVQAREHVLALATIEDGLRDGEERLPGEGDCGARSRVIPSSS